MDAMVIVRAVLANNRKWPDELTSGVMFFEGQRITYTEFMEVARR